MKFLPILFAALLVTPRAHAGWDRIASCRGAVVDVDNGERRNLQLVINDMDTLRALNRLGLAHLGFEQREFVIHGSTHFMMDFGRNTGPKAVFVYESKGVFYPQDFSYFTGDGLQSLNRGWVGRLISVYREGNGITLQYQNLEPKGCAGKTVPNGNPEGGPGDGQWGWYCDGDDYTSLSDVAKFHFDSCQ